MFCPECRSEFVEGVMECPDCGVSLVGKLPPEEYGGAREVEPDYVPLVRTYSPKDIALIHSVLCGTGICFFIRGENLTHLRPLADPSMLMVAEEDVEDVRSLLRDLPLSFYPWAPDGGHSPQEEASRDEADK